MWYEWNVPSWNRFRQRITRKACFTFCLCTRDWPQLWQLFKIYSLDWGSSPIYRPHLVYKSFAKENNLIWVRLRIADCEREALCLLVSPISRHLYFDRRRYRFGVGVSHKVKTHDGHLLYLQISLRCCSSHGPFRCFGGANPKCSNWTLSLNPSHWTDYKVWVNACRSE